jgi:hypothetical protein
MQSPLGAPAWLKVHTAAERPDLWERAQVENAFGDLWPEYNNHGSEAARVFSSLIPRYAQFQFLFIDQRSDRLVGRARTIPFRWNGRLEDLPAGFDALGRRALAEAGPASALSALAAEVRRDYRRCGLSSALLQAMGVVARHDGLSPLLAPVRPFWKDRYPLTPIERYASWVRGDGLPFDPWMRVHARLGARTVRPESESLGITAPVSDWERWTEMAFPEDGQYVFPGGLAPLSVSEGMGSYWEPNVWMLHDL